MPQETLKRGLVAAQKIAVANKATAAAFIEREEIALAFWLALAADRASFLLGSPGVGKTATTRFLAELVDGMKFYDELMPTVVSPEQLLVSETTIEESPTPTGGKAIRVSSKMGNAADAHLVFLDEIWETQPAVTKVLYDLLMADGVRLGGRYYKAPTMGVVAASNKLPEPGNQLKALWSRMAFRFVIKPLDRAGKMAMLKSQLARGKNGKTAVAPVMSLADVEALQAARPFVEVPDAIFELVLKIAYEDLYAHDADGFEWLVSDDRRFDVVREGLQAHALIHGRAVVTKADLAVLRHMLWDTPEQIPAVEAAVAPYCRTPLNDARNIIDDLLAVGGHVHRNWSGDTIAATKAMGSVGEAGAALKEIASNAGAEAPVIQRWVANLGVLSGMVARGAYDPSTRTSWDEITALFREGGA